MFLTILHILIRRNLEFGRDAVVDYFKAWEFFLLRDELDESEPGMQQIHEDSIARLNRYVDEVILPVADREGPFTGGMKAEVDANKRQLVVELLIATTDTSSVSLFYLL